MAPSGSLLVSGLVAAAVASWASYRSTWYWSLAARNGAAEANDNATNAGHKTILLYTDFFFDKHWEFGQLGKHPFEGCPVSNCVAEHHDDRTLEASAYDAVVFNLPNLLYAPPELERSPSQRYVLFTLESPADWHFTRYGEYAGYFNWTLTYREDSDVFHPNGWVRHRDSDERKVRILDEKEWEEFNMEDFVRSIPQRPESFGNSAKKKTKLAAWVVSKCETTSDREGYVAKLGEHIPVDILGYCSGTFCDDGCYRSINSDYKFYLAFENSLCNGYVTEKFWDRLGKGIIPVVRGQANYSKLAPPHSFIDVNDFASSKELGDYLLKLDKNDTEYLSYFWWKDHYEVQRDGILCTLCQRLKEDDGKSKIYRDIGSWWEDGSSCNLLKEPSSLTYKLLCHAQKTLFHTFSQYIMSADDYLK